MVYEKTVARPVSDTNSGLTSGCPWNLADPKGTGGGVKT
jgi:hypothetical protein